MLELPSELKEPIKLADWMELLALTSPDKNSSYGDLSSALRRTAAYEFNEDDIESDYPRQDEQIDEMCGEVFNEIFHRAKAAGHSYPFTISSSGSVLNVKTQASLEQYTAYTFCLCLSYFGSPLGTAANVPRRLFEDLSKYAAKNFIHGDAVKMSPPRTDLPSSFADAVTELCSMLGEGDGYKQQRESRIQPQDDRLDIVAWRHFPDRYPSKLIMFGQCASNKYWEDWKKKLSELQPREFCEQWMISVPAPPPIKSFFVPHCIDQGRWVYATRYAGVIFDRCRIALWAHNTFDYEKHVSWIKTVCLPNLDW